MKKIFVENVMKVIDVNKKSVLPETANFLLTHYRAYTDANRGMREDILNIVTATESDAEFKPEDKEVKKELKELGRLAAKNDAAYVRFIEY